MEAQRGWATRPSSGPSWPPSAGPPWRPCPAWGSILGNDGIVLIALNATDAASGAGSAPPPDPDTLYGGGAFLPWPGSPPPPPPPPPFLLLPGHRRAPHLLDESFGDTPTLAIGIPVLNTASRGSAHIQSADPLADPLVEAATLNAPADQAAWVYALRRPAGPPWWAPWRRAGTPC